METKTPQLENGYLRLAIEIVDNFQSLYLTPNEWKILWVVLRKTYGWQKKEDRISISQFQENTGLSRPNAHKAIKSLVAKSLLVAKPLPHGIVYSFNKGYSQWDSSYTATSSKITNTLVAKSLPPMVAKPLTKLVAKPLPTIDNINTITKDTIQKKVVLYSKIEDLTEADLQEIADKYKTPLVFVKSKLDDMIIWRDEKPNDTKRKDRNWRLTLMGWVKRDALKVIDKHNDKQRYTNKYKVTKL